VAIKVNEKGFIYDDSGVWYPPMNMKQLEVFDDYHRFLLVHGPRLSGKTMGLIHKTIRHAFDVNGAMIAIISKTLKNAKSAGVWFMLCRALPGWEQGCHGFAVVEGPKSTGDTKLSFVRIRNRHGGISEIQCHSLEHAQEVEAKFKGSNYSFIWASEIDQYCTEYAYDILCDSLRMTPYVPFEEHQIVCDCNPPDTGTNNWLHDRFFKFKDAKPTPDQTDRERVARERIHRILVMIDDNPLLDPSARDDLIERYRRKKSWYNRFVLGLWEQDVTDGHFSDAWDESIHVIGNADCNEDEREVIIPTAGCTVLLGGWDMGESKNHSFHVIEKIITEDPKTKRQLVSFSVIDELVVIRTYVSIRQFVETVMDKMIHWETFHKKRYGIDLRWRHWSDTSAFRERSAAETSEAGIAYEASSGTIVLEPAPKYKNSNRDKVKLLWQLLFEKRLFVSAQLFKTRTMFANLRSGKDSEYVKQDDHKHVFDSLSYPIIAECPMDMLRSANIESVKKTSSPGLVLASF